MWGPVSIVTDQKALLTYSPPHTSTDILSQVTSLRPVSRSSRFTSVRSTSMRSTSTSQTQTPSLTQTSTSFTSATGNTTSQTQAQTQAQSSTTSGSSRLTGGSFFRSVSGCVTLGAVFGCFFLGLL